MKYSVILGSGDVSYKNAGRLLNDHLPDDDSCLVVVPDLLGPDDDQKGLKNVIDWMDDVGQDYSHWMHEDISALMAAKDKDVEFLTLGLDDNLHLATALENDREVYDLSAALFKVKDVPGPPDTPFEEPAFQLPTPAEAVPVTVPPSVPQAVAKTAPGPVPTGLRAALPGAYNGSQGRDEFEKKLRDIMEEMIGKIMRAFEDSNGMIQPMVTVPEAHTGTAAVPQEPPWEPEVTPEAALPGEEPVRYYRSVTGKYRKAGKTKGRPKETEVFLSQAEINELDL